MKKKLLLLAATALMTFGMSFSSLAVTFNPTFKIEIDNIDECADNIKNKTFNYGVHFVKQRRKYITNYLYEPDWNNATAKTFNFTHGDTKHLYFGDVSLGDSNNPNLVFLPVGSTDSHLSFDRIEINNASAFSRFNYNSSNGGNYVKTSYTPSNWLKANGAVNSSTPDITLHFRYNPDISSVSSTNVEPFTVSKQIDYLYDNADATDKGYGKNDYRVYLTAKSKPEVEKAKDKDVVFVLDTSGSMGSSFGYGNRLDKLKEVTKKAVSEIIQKNPKNRVSIVTFNTSSDIIVKQSSNVSEIHSKINGLTQTGVTNYYKAFNTSAPLVSSVTGDRESAVFFISDGAPTYADPAVSYIGGWAWDQKRTESGSTYSGGAYWVNTSNAQNGYVPQAYAELGAQAYPKTSYFFSIFIGSSDKESSALQTVTQMIQVSKEKYMVKAEDSVALEDAFDRFLMVMDDALGNVVITDVNDKYTNVVGDYKLQVKEKNGALRDVDYYVATNTGKIVTCKIKDEHQITNDTDYVFSYTVISNKDATTYLDTKGDLYPNIGDPNTDYDQVKPTSSKQPGFYQAESSKLTYTVSGAKGEKEFPKPVVQNVKWRKFDINEPDFDLFTINTGKSLEDGDYTYAINYIGSAEFDEDDDGDSMDDYYEENYNSTPLETGFKILNDVFFSDDSGNTVIELKRRLTPKNYYVFHVKQTALCDTKNLKEPDERVLTVVLAAHTDGSVTQHYQFGEVQPTEGMVIDDSWKTLYKDQAFFNAFNIKANIY